MIPVVAVIWGGTAIAGTTIYAAVTGGIPRPHRTPRPRHKAPGRIRSLWGRP